MNEHGSHWIRPEKRLAIYIRDSFACAYCERDLRDSPAAMLTLDHLIPRSQGGTNDARNLVLACRPCNSRRGVAPWALFASTTADVNRIDAVADEPLNIELARALMAGTVPGPVRIVEAAR